MFLRRQTGEAADDEDKLPGVGIVLRDVRISPRGHTGEANAVFNDVVDFAVGEILRGGHAEIRSFGIEILADVGWAGAIVAVTVGTAICKMLASFRQ